MESKAMRLGAVATALACSIGGLALAAPASAAQSAQSVTCADQQLTVRTGDNNSSDMGGWGAAQVVDGSGHLIPTSFSGTFYDNTIGATIFQFAEIKGAGKGNHNQPAVTCVQESTGTLGDFLDPGDELPPGTSASDQVTFTITISAVPKS